MFILVYGFWAMARKAGWQEHVAEPSRTVLNQQAETGVRLGSMFKACPVTSNPIFQSRQGSVSQNSTTSSRTDAQTWRFVRGTSD